MDAKRCEGEESEGGKRHGDGHQYLQDRIEPIQTAENMTLLTMQPDDGASKVAHITEAQYSQCFQIRPDDDIVLERGAQTRPEEPEVRSHIRLSDTRHFARPNSSKEETLGFTFQAFKLPKITRLGRQGKWIIDESGIKNVGMLTSRQQWSIRKN